MGVRPPRPRLPPLNALRAFEAAARTGSFTRAAAELNVTQAAVAQQVKALEAWLGCRLFDRLAHGLRLSGRGSAALPALVRAFDMMGEAVRELQAAARPERIEIAALPAVAMLWLAPRLPAIRAAFPEASISVTASETPPNLLREPYDLALFYLPAAAPDADADGAAAVRLHADRIAPVCSPRIAPACGEDPAAWLERQTLLHDSAWASDWDRWLRAAGCEQRPGAGSRATDGPRFSLYGVAVQAAQDGAGVLIGHDGLIDAALRRGDLVAPFATWVATGQHLVAMLPARSRPLARRLVEWLSLSARPAAPPPP